MTPTIRISRPIARAARAAGARLLRVVMVLSLWHAPIPWIHVHEFEGPQVDRLETLSRHVTAFHASDLLWGNTLPTWHAHVVLPWCLNHHHDCPANEQHDPGRDDILAGTGVTGIKLAGSHLSPGQAFGQPSARAFVAVDFLADEAALAHSGMRTGGDISRWPGFRKFFETYGSSVAVRDLLSFRLC